MASGGHCELGYEDKRFETVVSPSFYCPICLLVLREPVMCKNQHYYCSSCIKKHLAKSAFCPTCLEHLSVDILNEAPRIVKDYLSELNIHCDYYARGCREMVKLDQLKQHVATCGFTPVQCSNEGCTADLNLRDKLYHQAEVCDFRRLKCHECSQLKHEVVEEMKREILVRQDQMMKTLKAEISACQNEIVSEMKEGTKRMEDVILNEVQEIVNKAVQNITMEMKVASARVKNELTEKIKDQFQAISLPPPILMDQKQEEARRDVAKKLAGITKQSVAVPWPGDAEIIRPIARTERDMESIRAIAKTEGDTESIRAIGRTEGDIESTGAIARTEGDTESGRPIATTEGDTESNRVIATIEGETESIRPIARAEGDTESGSISYAELVGRRPRIARTERGRGRDRRIGWTEGDKESSRPIARAEGDTESGSISYAEQVERRPQIARTVTGRKRYRNPFVRPEEDWESSRPIARTTRGTGIDPPFIWTQEDWESSRPIARTERGTGRSRPIGRAGRKGRRK